MHPFKVELEDELIRVTDTDGERHWYRVTDNGELEGGTPITTWHDEYIIHLFIPRVAGIPLLIPTVRKVEHHRSH
jgi:hypothetical protein